MSEKVCPICGATFATRTSAKYCSSACAYKAHAEQGRLRQRALRKRRGVPDADVGPELLDMAAATASACKAVDALTYRQRMRLEILLDTEGESDGQDAD